MYSASLDLRVHTLALIEETCHAIWETRREKGNLGMKELVQAIRNLRKGLSDFMVQNDGR